MAKLSALEWEAIAQAKRAGHGQVTDAHLVAAAVADLELPADLVAQLQARSKQILASLPQDFATPALTDSARTLLASIEASGPEAALRQWVTTAPTPPAPVQEAPAKQAVPLAGAQSAPDPKSAGTPTDGQTDEQQRAQILAAAQAELDGLVGLVPVKEHIRQVVNWTLWNRSRTEAGLPDQQQGLHLVFTGPPGTGKTTVARIYGRMMQGLGVLRSDRFVEVGRNDLVAEHVGGTALKTQAVLNRALDGVLFIDEAYALSPERGGSEFGQEAVATILAFMENHRDRIVVIAAGYDKEMGQFLDSNPGLRSRFGTVIDFPRYSPDELLTIFQTMANTAQLDADDKVLAAVRQRIQRVGGGNARNVRLLLESATRRMADRALADGRIDPHELRVMTVADILGGPDSRARQAVLDQALADLAGLVGLSAVKARIADLVSRQAWSRARVEAGMTVPDSGLNLVFTGPPGTGKTTVARIVARIYQGLGLLDRGQLVEVTPKDLIGEYVGQTAPRTQAVLDRAAGGVLFIDEAYGLLGRGDRDYGPEAINTLVSYLENNRDTLAVVLAGYPDEMDQLLNANPGLRSRVGTSVRFPDYTVGELVEIFVSMLAEQGLSAGPGVTERVGQLLSASGTEGNARSVRTLVEGCVSAMATRASVDGQITADELAVITVADIPEPAARKGQIGFR